MHFSDPEELEFADRTELQALANTINKRIQQLAHSFETGQAIKNGIPVAIVGKTNVGKSTLLNRLIHEDKAIVSNIHGTTRDVIEDTTVINGISFRFIDTAGIRNTTDEVERLGIERTYKKLQEARIILWVIDNTPSESDLERIIESSASKRLIVVCNKIDKTNITLPSPLVMPRKTQYAESDSATTDNIIPIIKISAKHGANISNLESAIYTAADIPSIQEGDVIITNTRHYNALCQAHSNLQRVKEAFATNLSGDLIAEDLRSVLSDLAEITGGKISSQETLNSIFSEFCIGK